MFIAVFNAGIFMSAALSFSDVQQLPDLPVRSGASEARFSKRMPSAST